MTHKQRRSKDGGEGGEGGDEVGGGGGDARAGLHIVSETATLSPSLTTRPWPNRDSRPRLPAASLPEPLSLAANPKRCPACPLKGCWLHGYATSFGWDECDIRWVIKSLLSHIYLQIGTQINRMTKLDFSLSPLLYISHTEQTGCLGCLVSLVWKPWAEGGCSNHKASVPQRSAERQDAKCALTK